MVVPLINIGRFCFVLFFAGFKPQYGCLQLALLTDRSLVVRGRPSSPPRTNTTYTTNINNATNNYTNKSSNNTTTGNSKTVVVVDSAHAYLFDRVDYSSDPFRRQQNFLIVGTNMRLNQVLTPLFALPPGSLIPRPTATAMGTADAGHVRQHSRAWSTASTNSSYSGSYRHTGSISPGSSNTTSVTVTATCTEYSTENLSGASHIFLLRQFDSAAALVGALNSQRTGTSLVLTVRRGPLQYTLVNLAPDVPIVVLRRIHAQVLAGHARVTGFVDLTQRSEALNTITALHQIFPHTATFVSPSVGTYNSTCSSNMNAATVDIMSGSEDEQWHNESTDTSIDSVMLKSPLPLSKNIDYESIISLLRATLLETQSTLQRTQAELERKTAELEECQAGYIELAEMASTVLLDPQPAISTSTNTHNPLSTIQDVIPTHSPNTPKAKMDPASNNAIGSTTPVSLSKHPHPPSSPLSKTRNITTTTNLTNTNNNLNDPGNDNYLYGAGANSEVQCRCCVAQADALKHLEQALATRDLEIRGLRAEHVTAHRETQYLIKRYNSISKEASLLRQKLDELKASNLSILPSF